MLTGIKMITSFWTAFIMPGQYKYWQIIASLLSISIGRRYVWYQCNMQLWSINWIIILSSHIIRLEYILRTLQKEPLLYWPVVYFSIRLWSFHWYWSTSFKFTGKQLQVFLQWSHVVYWYPLLVNCDSASATIFFLPWKYSISRPLYSSISLRLNNLLVLKFHK